MFISINFKAVLLLQQFTKTSILSVWSSGWQHNNFNLFFFLNKYKDTKGFRLRQKKPPMLIRIFEDMHKGRSQNSQIVAMIFFFLDIILNSDLLHTREQRILLMLTKPFYILENKLQCVSVKLSYGTGFDWVVDSFFSDSVHY